MDRVDGEVALKFSALELTAPAVMFAKIEMPLTATVKPPPAAADVPPPTNEAVTEAFVRRATLTFWSIVTVKLLE
jgi:hypothetical protein